MIWNISENIANVNVTLKYFRTKLLYDFDIALTIIACNKIPELLLLPSIHCF